MITMKTYLVCDTWHLSVEGSLLHAGPALAGSSGGAEAVTATAEDPAAGVDIGVICPENRGLKTQGEPPRAYLPRASNTSGLVAELRSSISLGKEGVR